MRSLVTILTVISGIVAGSINTARAESPEGSGTFPWEGEVTGSNVYVRSGAGGNWYPTDKLGIGARVLVLGEKFGWYEIVPPNRSFSYIDRSMVQRSQDGKTGIVSRDDVYTRAGSRLNTRKNATQKIVAKGTRVDIIGEAEAFYKIVPVRGASLFISKQYVKMVEPRQRTGLLERYLAGKSANVDARVPAELDGDSTEMEAGASERDSAMSTGSLESEEPVVPVSIIVPPTESVGGKSSDIDDAIAKDETDALVSSEEAIDVDDPLGVAPAGTGRYAAMLAALESDLEAEMRKPPAARSLAEIRMRYESIASQEEEYVPGAIAKIRMRQLSDRIRLQAARAQMGTEREALDDFREQFRRDRMELARIKADAAAVERFDLEGELRISYAFAPEKRRFRLVDPRRNMTVAYVDIPRDVNSNTQELIGRYVGIQASRSSYSPSARVSIAVASRIVDLTREIAPTPEANASGGENISVTGYNTSEETRPSEVRDGNSSSAVAAGPEADD